MRPTELFPALREEEMAETTRSDAETARMVFYVVAVLMAIYGLVRGTRGGTPSRKAFLPIMNIASRRRFQSK